MNGNMLIGISALIDVAAVLVQLTAAFYALKLVRITGKSAAWFLICGALALMATRRSIILYHFFIEPKEIDIWDFWDALVALGISGAMLAGVFTIKPLFLTIKRAAETLSRAKEDLELKVAKRTEELRDANNRLAVELEERRLAQEELARSNTELEQFAYVASHDLQEPLRMVGSFTQLLGKRYQGKLDSDADDFINYAVDGASRMQQLLNDLLSYSRVGTRGKPLVPIDCNSILIKTLANLAPLIEESGAVITHNLLPKVQGDEVQLIQLFQNLLANAIKFRQETPRIRVSAEQKGSEWIFAVRDNGIGIAPEQQERIFMIFQRLHHRSEYPGTGIGLALCKKIVQRHGGRIWVKSALGQGSTFYFTLKGAENDGN